MLEKLSTETLESIFDTLPVDVTFVDDTDTVRYYSTDSGGNRQKGARLPSAAKSAQGKAGSKRTKSRPERCSRILD